MREVLLFRMKEEEGKKICYRRERGRARPCLYRLRSCLTLWFFFVLLGFWTGTAVPPHARAVPSFQFNGLIFFFIFLIIFGQLPTKQIKIKQNKQNKSN